MLLKHVTTLFYNKKFSFQIHNTIRIWSVNALAVQIFNKTDNQCLEHPASTARSGWLHSHNDVGILKTDKQLLSLTRPDKLGTRVDSMPARIALLGKISVSARVKGAYSRLPQVGYTRHKKTVERIRGWECSEVKWKLPFPTAVFCSPSKWKAVTLLLSVKPNKVKPLGGGSDICPLSSTPNLWLRALSYLQWNKTRLTWFSKVYMEIWLN